MFGLAADWKWRANPGGEFRIESVILPGSCAGRARPLSAPRTVRPSRDQVAPVAGNDRAVAWPPVRGKGSAERFGVPLGASLLSALLAVLVRVPNPPDRLQAVSMRDLIVGKGLGL